jgi:L-galactose dehydrogenase
MQYFDRGVMKVNALGKTGLQVSAIGLGASSLGGGVFGDVDEAVAIRTVHAALSCGVTLIDVSPFYGHTQAEVVLGKALKGIPRDRFVLSTKAGRYGDGLFDFSAKRVEKSIDESLQRLGIEYVDILHAHDIEYGDLNLIVEETVPALRGIVAKGKARHIGVTGYPLAALNTVVEHSAVDCVLSYDHCSLNDTTLLDVLPMWHRLGIGVINAGAFSQGLLISEKLPVWHPAPEEVRRSCRQAVQLIHSQGGDPATLAIQYATMQPGIASTLAGVTSPEEIEAAVRAVEQSVDTELLKAVLHILEPIHNCGWQTGRQENN